LRDQGHAPARVELRRRDPPAAEDIPIARRPLRHSDPDPSGHLTIATPTMAPVQAVILCGGLGTRLSEETDLRPKPMVEIGGKPILWHIMKTYSHYGVVDFI